MPAAIKLASFWQERRKSGQLCAKMYYTSSSFGFLDNFGMLIYIWDRSQLQTIPNPDQEEAGLTMLMSAIELASFRQRGENLDNFVQKYDAFQGG